jgi:hypothetical protein
LCKIPNTVSRTLQLTIDQHMQLHQLLAAEHAKSALTKVGIDAPLGNGWQLNAGL